jgi:hypothetical protein
VIEVQLVGNRWMWTLIAACGRVLAYSPETFPCNVSANNAAKRYRSALWRLADEIDHRQARAW